MIFFRATLLWYNLEKTKRIIRENDEHLVLRQLYFTSYRRCFHGQKSGSRPSRATAREARAGGRAYCSAPAASCRAAAAATVSSARSASAAHPSAKPLRETAASTTACGTMDMQTRARETSATLGKTNYINIFVKLNDLRDAGSEFRHSFLALHAQLGLPLSCPVMPTKLLG